MFRPLRQWTTMQLILKEVIWRSKVATGAVDCNFILALYTFWFPLLLYTKQNSPFNNYLNHNLICDKILDKPGAWLLEKICFMCMQSKKLRKSFPEQFFFSYSLYGLRVRAYIYLCHVDSYPKIK